MILELAVLAVVAGGAYLVGTKKGKADVADLKVKLADLLPKFEAKLSAAEASVKAGVLGVVAEIKIELSKL